MAAHSGTPSHMASLGPRNHVESWTRPEDFCCSNGPSCSQDPPLHASQKAWAGRLAAGTDQGSPTSRLLHSGRAQPTQETVCYSALVVTLSQGMGRGEGPRSRSTCPPPGCGARCQCRQEVSTAIVAQAGNVAARWPQGSWALSPVGECSWRHRIALDQQRQGLDTQCCS